jgi:1-deoxy-D-xylulose-5-phosphate synthase
LVAVYSSFLQRSYDQILHDVALQNLHVVFAIDRAGIVGEDGETHQGIYDLSYLRHIPNMTILSPASYSEFTAMLEYAVLIHNGPIAIRYPRGNGPYGSEVKETINLGKGLKIREGSDISIIAVGNMMEQGEKASDILEEHGVSVELINARFIKPLDSSLILDTAKKTGRILTLEDNVLSGGFGSGILELLNDNCMKACVKALGFPDEPVTHGSRKQLFEKYGLHPDAIAQEALKFLGKV